MWWRQEQKKGVPARLSTPEGKGVKHYGTAYEQIRAEANAQGRPEKTASCWRTRACKRHAAWAVRRGVRGGDRNKQGEKPSGRFAIQNRGRSVRRNGFTAVVVDSGRWRDSLAPLAICSHLQPRAWTRHRAGRLSGTRRDFQREDFSGRGRLPKDREDGGRPEPGERSPAQGRQGLSARARHSRTSRGGHMRDICGQHICGTYYPHYMTLT